MSDLPRFVEILLIAVAGVALTTMIYRLLPYRTWTNKKPGFVLFPKYVATYACPTEDIRAALENLNFERQPSGTYTRGKIYGDFSLEFAKMRVDIVAANKEVRVQGALFGIVFDTGDTWKLTSEIITGGGVSREHGAGNCRIGAGD